MSLHVQMVNMEKIPIEDVQPVIEPVKLVMEKLTQIVDHAQPEDSYMEPHV